MLSEIVRYTHHTGLLAGTIALAGELFYGFWMGAAVAQLSPDSSLGTEMSQVQSNATVQGLPTEVITGGAARGTNLFHSFQTFNVGDGQRVYFANPAKINNILTRVTGNTRSDILGTLGVDGSANLFLLNPNGILFGPNAQLDIAGSFVASTASKMLFSNGSEFSAVNPAAPPLLTVNLTPGIQYGSSAPDATIASAGHLIVGENLALIASKLDLQGQLQAGKNLTLQASDTVKIRDRTTTPFIAVAGKQMSIHGDRTIDIFTLNHADSGLFSGDNMLLRSPKIIGDAHYWTGSNFRVEQLDGTLGNWHSPTDPIIRALGDVSFNIYLGQSLHILAGGTVDVSRVLITGPENRGTSPQEPAIEGIDFIREQIQLSDGRSILIDGSARPTLDIRAGIDPALIGTPSTTGFTVTRNPLASDSFLLAPLSLTNAPTRADINIGHISFSRESSDRLVVLTNQYRPNPLLPGKINILGLPGIPGTGINVANNQGGGDIFLDSRSDIELAANRDLNAVAGDGGVNEPSLGDGGNIVLLARGDIILGEQSDIVSQGLGAGEITLQSDGDILAMGSRVEGNVFATDPTLTGGDVTVTARSLFASQGALFNAHTSGAATAGNVNVNVRKASLDGESGLSSRSLHGATGDAGNIEIGTDTLLVDNRSSLDAVTLGTGRAGNVIIRADGSVVFDRNSTISSQAANPNSTVGDITIATGSLILSRGSVLHVGASGNVDAGQLRIQADKIVIDGENQGTRSGLIGLVRSNSTGNAGGIILETGDLVLTNGGILDVNTSGSGNAGRIVIQARGNIIVDGETLNRQPSAITSLVGANSTGNSGGIEIAAGRVSVTNGGLVSVGTMGQGNAGRLIIRAREINIDGERSNGTPSRISSAVQSGAVGNAGGIEIATDFLSVNGGGQLEASTFGQGDAGGLNLTAKQLVFNGASRDGRIFSAATSAVHEGAIGDAGDLNVSANSIFLSHGAQFLASTSGQGNGGKVFLRASHFELRNGSSVSTAVNPGAIGQGGTVDLQTDSLLLDDDAQLRADTFGQGNAGNIFLRTSQTNLRFGSAISSAVNAGALGQGGTVDLTADFLNLNQARILSSTEGQGDAGRINLGATQSIVLANGSTIASTAGTGTSGDGGSIVLQAPVLLLLDGSQISVSTEGLSDSNAGQISLQGDRIALQDESQLAATTAGGTSGGIGVNARILEVLSGGQIRTTTSGNSAAGDIVLQVLDSIILDGNDSGLFANTVSGSSGAGGSILIDPRMMAIRNRAGIVVDSQGSGSGGNIQVQAGTLTLDNQARISAITASSQGGNINLLIDGIVLLRRNSSISATAGTAGAGGDGGNIDIQALFVVAPPTENSDITANAFAGRGGNISFTTNGIFGPQFREQLTPFSDITVSSQFGIDGTVVFDILGVDPSRGIAEFPDFIAPFLTVATGCSAGRGDRGTFSTVGGGGIPANLPEDAPIGPILPGGIWRLLDDTTHGHDDALPEMPARSYLVSSRRPAQELRVDANGDGWLTATVSSQSTLFVQPSC